MQYHLDVLQSRVEFIAFIKRKNTVLQIMLSRQFFDRLGTSSGEYRPHPALHRKPRDQFAGIAVRAINEKCFFHSRHQVLALSDLVHSPDLPVFEPDLYSVWVKRRICEQIFYDADSLFAGPLILLQHDRYFHSGPDVFSFTMRHKLFGFQHFFNQH
jgi:hypothetical protein